MLRLLAAVLGVLLLAAWLATHTCVVVAPMPAGLPSALPSAAAVSVPAKIVGGHFLVTVQSVDGRAWRFLVDTGSTTTLVSPEFARFNPKIRIDPSPSPVLVRSASGGTLSLESIHVGLLELGDMQFKDTSALVYNCDDLSAHFGQKIDGVLGFPLFRHLLLTLDYPRSELVLTPPTAATPPLPGHTLHFNNDRRVPLIPVQLNGQPFIALIDSGSDGSLHLNPAGLSPDFLSGPRPGGMIGTLSGNQTLEVGRLAQNLTVGGYTFVRPIVELTGELSSLGSDLLKNFRITFDQTRNQVTFFREAGDTVSTPPLRSVGLSFQKFPAYWHVVGILPGSPAEGEGVRIGDNITRINDEPVAQWPLPRYNDLVRTAKTIRFTFLSPLSATPKPDAKVDAFPAPHFAEIPLSIPTFDLVP